MRLSLAIILVFAAGLICGLPITYNENIEHLVLDEDESQQERSNSFHFRNKIDRISQLFDVGLNGLGGIDSGNNGNSNGDDGSHKPPSKRSQTTDQAYILRWHHSFVKLPDLVWNDNAEDLAQARVNKCSSDEMRSHNGYFAIGHASWNEVLNAWWDKTMVSNDNIKGKSSQLTNQKIPVSVGCAMQSCPRGRYYACNYILSSDELGKN